MRRILANGLFALGLLALLAALASSARAATATEGLADLGWFIFALLLVAVSGGLMGGYLLAAPGRPRRWRLVLAAVLAVATLAAAGLVLTMGIEPGTLRVAAVLLLVAVPAAGGLVRVPSLWRS